MPDVPAIAQILVIFSLVVLATALKVHMGLAAALGGIALALWQGLGFSAVSGAIIDELFNADTLLLFALMVCIMAFSSAMKKSGAMDSFANAIGVIAPSKRLAMAIAPLLIGTLPMPGGAILSAPLVEAMDSKREHGSGTLSAANYWFRHNLELAWPLYPSFILTTSLSGISATKLISLNFYAAPILFALGLVFVLPPLGKNSSRKREALSASLPYTKKLASSIRGIAPLALVLGLYAILSALWNRIAPWLKLPDSAATLIGRYLPILLGLAAGSVYIGLGPKGFSIFRGSVNAATLTLVAVIAGIRIFSSLISAAGLAGAAATELSQAGIPTIVAVAIIPLIAGLVTGVGFGYVGLAFPIVLGLVPQGSAFPREAAIVLAGAFGYAGMMLSPLHVCMVVSAEHFKASLPNTIRRVALPLAIFIAIAIFYTWALSLALH